ncbi:hypothetical protein [Mesorhizobium sp. B4-1-4]|uniref:hypothetical protein n=1 Tax=Mesorhizobium sp. B4-1-4 TaxID=2589888 RepID=UPI00112B326E|nr:hypothetical protein [Mesorhizobium sp. B4-1-4]UCI33757.1 hypothetical protein FJW03_10195 [Mesorhizobium sp. B4-1-4]
MLKKIAFAAVLIQVAAFSALITQTVLFASSTTTHAANVAPGEAVAAVDRECTQAMWRNIPDHCLRRIEATRPIATTILRTAAQ